MTRRIVFAFIDSQNLNLGIRNNILRKDKIIYKGWKLDYKRFYRYLVDRYHVSKAFLLIGRIHKNQELYFFLREIGYRLVLKPMVKVSLRSDFKVKGNVDTELVLHAMIEYKNYDGAIIVSGDGDFHCLIEYLEANGKLDFILVPNRFAYSRLLNDFYTKLRFVNEMRAKLEKKRGDCCYKHKNL